MAETKLATAEEFSVAAENLYTYWTLNCLAEISYAVSNDAVARPQLYQSDEIPDDLVTLRMSYGTTPHLPNSAQRQAMITPILGPSDGSKIGMMTAASQSPFQIARRKFVDACTAFAQQASDIEGDILEAQVRSSAETLRAHFEGIRGKSFQLTAQQINALFDIATRILKSPGITKVFGIGRIESGWPLDSMDPNGAKFVESAGTALSLSGDSKLTFTDFLLLQRIAREGSQAIHVLLSADPLSDEQLKVLISKGYTWGASLREASSGAQYPPQPPTGVPTQMIPQMIRPGTPRLPGTQPSITQRSTPSTSISP
jgi:hypothetical protein